MSGPRRASDGEVIRAISLRKQGWSLIDIAVAVGVSESTVSRWCRGRTRRSVTAPVFAAEHGDGYRLPVQPTDRRVRR